MNKPSRNGKKTKEQVQNDSLLQKLYAEEPDLPGPNADGLYPAIETLDALQARDVIRARRKLGLSREQLAQRAQVRLETLLRIEDGPHPVSVRTLAKVDRALREAQAEAGR